MADLVRVRIDGVEKNVGSSFAKKHGLEVLDESTHTSDGRRRGTTRSGGRPAKPKTTVKKAAEKKAGAAKAPDTEAVIESADDKKEQD